MMREAAKIVVVAGLALAVPFGAVMLCGDTTVTVPPPESVGEQFARQIAAGRYERALQYVAEWSGITLTTVRIGGASFRERAGRVDRVEGEPGWIEENRAAARAVLMTSEAGRVRFSYRFERRRGLWKIVEWGID